MKKQLTALCFALLLSTVFAFNTNAASFSDVPTSHRYYKEITTLADLGVIKGYEDGTFKPGVYITRAQSLNILDRVPDMYVLPIRNMREFSDLKRAYPYYAVFERFYRGGIINGDGNFMYPSNIVTRGQIAKMFTLYFDFTAASNVSFIDVPASSDKYPYVSALAANGVTTGDAGYFYPNKHLTREHLAVWLYRALYN